MQNLTALIGRVLIAYLYIPSGIAKLTGFAGTVGYIASKGLPLPELGAAIAVVVELLIAAAFLVGFKTRVAAAVLALFTVAAAVLFHNYWALPAGQQMMQQLLFTKNIAVVGGLLAFVAFGAGAFSLDARRTGAPASARAAAAA